MKIFVDCDVLLDAMQCASAMACHADIIISRNIKDFQNSPIKAMTPEQFLLESTF